MSYCRWSCLNGYSDVYVYANVTGAWTTHVASRRQPEGAPRANLSVLLECSFVAYQAATKAKEVWQEANPSTAIDHPEAGETFNHLTPGECADNLVRLADEGFIVPRWAVDDLRAEQTEDT